MLSICDPMLLIFEAVRYSIVDYTRDKFWAIGTHTRVTHNTQHTKGRGNSYK